MKNYVFNYNPYILNTQEIITYFDQYPFWIRNWLKPFEGTFLICSEHSVSELTAFIAAKYSQQLFLVSETNPKTTDGRLTAANWEFVTNPKTSGLWEKLISQPMNSTIAPSTTALQALASSAYLDKK